MSVASRFYNRENSFTSGDMNDVLSYLEDYDDDANAKDKYLDDVPYSSSSVDVDRSSIGSIPWADDAIKQNQLDWERIERMLRGGEEGTAASLPANQPELQNEIAEWQRKFPQLLLANSDGTNQKQQQQAKNEVEADALADNSRTTTGRALHNNTLNIRSISNLSLDSLEEDNDVRDVDANADESLNGKPLNSRLSLNFDEHEEFRDNPLATMTPTNQPQQRRQFNRLASLLSTNLRIRSVPLTLRHRRQQVPSTPFDDDDGDDVDEDEDNFSVASSPVPPTPPPRHPPKSLLIAAPTAHMQPPPPLPHAISQAARRTRMPPILNVLESTRRFRGLANSHRSFVQLTQIIDQQQQQQQPQAKSAAIRTPGVRKFNTHSTAWHAPLAAAKVSSSFMNHRNAIILPSINRQTSKAQQLMTSTTTETTSENGRGIGGRNASRGFINSSSSPSSRTYNYLLPQQQHQQQQRQLNNLNGIAAAAAAATTSTSTTGTPSSNTGRSISAVVHHQHQQHPRRMEFNALYLPYSAASKFKAFK